MAWAAGATLLLAVVVGGGTAWYWTREPAAAEILQAAAASEPTAAQLDTAAAATPPPRPPIELRLTRVLPRTNPTLGRAAARAVAAHLHGVVARQGEARVIFACAPSQDQFLAALIHH